MAGKKYEFEGVSTVQYLQDRLQQQLGVDPTQHTVRNGWKRLTNDDMLLSEAGVKDGALLKVTPARSKSLAKQTAFSNSAESLVTNPMFVEGLKDLKSDWTNLSNDMQSLTSDAVFCLHQFSAMVNDPRFRAALEDPEKLELMRQSIVTNREFNDIKSAMMKVNDVLNDPVKWQKTMTEASSAFFERVDDEDFLEGDND